jgi:TBC1 domain family protein 5
MVDIETDHKTGLHEKSKRIYNEYLNIVDEDLYKHLKTLRVEPHIFLLRWIRCLFIREY